MSEQIESYVIKASELSIKILNYGATIADVCYKGKHVVLRFADLENYRNRQLNQAFGSSVGRVANRIADGKLFLNNKQYDLEQNNGSSCLHGGSNGFAHRFWSLVKHEPSLLHLRLKSDHLDQNFPGSIVVDAKFTMNGNSLAIHYSAKLSDDSPDDMRTVVNLTNHAYFNLNGCEPAESAEKTPNILNHEVYSQQAKAYLEQNDDQVPTRRLVELQEAKAPMQIQKGFVKLADGCKTGLYDHSFVFETDVDRYGVDGLHQTEFYDVDLICPQSAVKLNVRTNNYSCHIYTGPRENILNYEPFTGVCLEAQAFPNACNVPEWLNQCLVKKGQAYHRSTIFSFSDLPKS